MLANIKNKKFITELLCAVWEALDPKDQQYVKEVSREDFQEYMLAVLPNQIDCENGFYLGNFILMLHSNKVYDLFKDFVATK